MLLAIALVTPALAAPGTLYVSGVTAPTGMIWIGSHLWVSDAVKGLCRVDNVGGVNTLTNCDTQAKAPAQIAADSRLAPDGSVYLYVADSSTKSTGVVRLNFNPVTETIVAGSGVVLAGGSQQSGFRSSSVVINPVDGNVYVGFIKSPNIVRITTPNGSSQTAIVIGQTSDGRKGLVGGMAIDQAGYLFLSEKGGNGVTVIPDVQECQTVINGVVVQCGFAEITSIQSFFPKALTGDTQSRIYIGESPATLTQGLPSSVLRYAIFTDVQDVVSSQHQPTPPYDPYKGIFSIAVGPDGSIYIAEDPTLGLTFGVGKVWVVGGTAPLDALGAPGVPALAPPPLAVAPPATIQSWGHQAPNGFIFLPGALGGHMWAADESGLCRLDPAPNGPLAINVEVCDPGSIGTPATPALDPRVNADGTQYLYVPEIDRFSRGVWRVKYNPGTETIQPQVELMAPSANLGAMRPNSVALGPDMNLYVTGKASPAAMAGAIFRITTPNASSTRYQQAIRIGTTSDGKGTNGSMVFVGNDLYLPENNDLGVIRNAATCATAGSPAQCTAAVIPLQNVFFAAALATDGTNVYVANSPGSAPAIIVRYNTTSQAEVIFLSGGQLPANSSPSTTVNSSVTGTRTEASLQDPLLFSPPPYPFRFILAMYVDPSGNLHFGDDPFAGSRAQRGHHWIASTVVP